MGSLIAQKREGESTRWTPDSCRPRASAHRGLANDPGRASRRTAEGEVEGEAEAPRSTDESPTATQAERQSCSNDLMAAIVDPEGRRRRAPRAAARRLGDDDPECIVGSSRRFFLVLAPCSRKFGLSRAKR